MAIIAPPRPLLTLALELGVTAESLDKLGVSRDGSLWLIPEHDADGQGIVLSADWSIFFKRNWALNLTANYQTWDTDPGMDRVFAADGTILETRLNEVEWNSYAIMLGAIYRF